MSAAAIRERAIELLCHNLDMLSPESAEMTYRVALTQAEEEDREREAVKARGIRAEDL